MFSGKPGERTRVGEELAEAHGLLGEPARALLRTASPLVRAPPPARHSQ